MANKVISFIQILITRNQRVNVVQRGRYYMNWVHRTPVKIINKDNSCESKNSSEKLRIERMVVKLGKPALNSSFMEDAISTTSTNALGSVKANVTNETNLKLSRESNVMANDIPESSIDNIHNLETSEEKPVVPSYTRLQGDDPKISNVLLIVKSRSQREKKNLILLEGKRLLNDAIEAGIIPHMVFFSRSRDINDLCIPSVGVELYKVPYKTLSLWSDLTTCPGIMGIAETPQVHKKRASKNCLPLTIICDNVRDPGNLGSILRAAAGVDCQRVVLMKGCVDLWEPKVLRTGAGAHFRVPILKGVSWSNMDTYLTEECSVFVGDHKLRTVMDDGNHSVKLNRIEKTTVNNESNGQVTEGQNIADTKTNEDRQSFKGIPLLPYYAVDFTHQKSIALVVGGETEGLSDEALKLVTERNGVRLNIPLSNNVESLNTGTALGILAFEMKRQFSLVPRPVYSEEEANQISIHCNS